MNQNGSNKYFLCYPNEAVPWDIRNPPVDEWTRTRYFGKVLQEVEKTLDSDGFTFYLTANINELPSYGRDVIALLQEDQPSRIPRYVDRVLVTFTCHGTDQPFKPNPFVQPSLPNFLSAIQFVRNAVLGVPGRVRYMWKQLSGPVPPIHTIPLGYANQADHPLIPIEERSHDIFFAGSVEHNIDGHGIKQWLGTPKYYARRQMIASLNTIRRQHPDIQVDVQTRTTFQASMEASADAYAQRMMNAKICPVPRGTSLESYRLFEALRFGCIPIVEALPSRWFYDHAPVIQIDDWREIEDLVPELVRDPSLLRQKHEAVLHWWNTRCSEHAVGQFIADKIKKAVQTD